MYYDLLRFVFMFLIKVKIYTIKETEWNTVKYEILKYRSLRSSMGKLEQHKINTEEVI